MARVKTKEESVGAGRSNAAHLRAFDALMATAGLDPQLSALAGDEVSSQSVNAALSQALEQAQQRWGLGLHHLPHQARLIEGDQGPDIALLADGRVIAKVLDGSQAIASAYRPLMAPDERGLSMWGALSEGHRVSAEAPYAHLKVLIEEARDFETHWQAARGGMFSRIWRQGDTLHLEVARPASPQAALSDAAWDVITSIKDRTFQRELMRRSEELGMLGALLAARHTSASGNLARLPEAHFTVQALIDSVSGPQARSAEHYRTRLKDALTELESQQAAATKQLAEVLRHGLTSN